MRHAFSLVAGLCLVVPASAVPVSKGGSGQLRPLSVKYLPDDADAVAVVIDDIGQVAARAGKPPAQPLDVLVQTTDPTRSFLLRSTADGIELAPVDLGAATDGTPSGSSPARLSLPGEALIRLVYGRLDERHTPALEADGVDLDDLRAAFPGL